MSKIVVWDPDGQLPEGMIIYTDRMIEDIKHAGVVALPIDAFKANSPVNGVSDYVRRSFADENVYLPATVPARTCKTAIWVDPNRTRIAWALRLCPMFAGSRTNGTITVTVDTSQRGVISGSVNSQQAPIDLSRLGDPSHYGGWTLYGSFHLTTHLEGLLGLCVYGAGSGVEMAWLAVTQSTG